MQKKTNKNRSKISDGSLTIPIFSFVLALVFQSILLWLLWYVCINSEIKKTPKLVTISLLDFFHGNQQTSVSNQEPVLEPLNHVMEETEIDKIIEPELNELEPINELEDITEKIEHEIEPIIEEVPLLIEEIEEPIKQLEPLLEEKEPIIEIEPELDDLSPILDEISPIKELQPVLEEIKPKKPIMKPKEVKQPPRPKPIEKKETPVIKQEIKPKEEVKPVVEKVQTPSVSLPSSEIIKTPSNITNNVSKPVVKQSAVSLGREADLYMARVARLFEKKKKYPETARKKHISGFVKLRFYINMEGKVSNCKALNNPDRLLLEAAIELVTKLQLPKPPKEWEADRPVVFNINYNLK